MSHASGQPGAGPSRRGFIGAAGATAALSSIPGLRSPGPVSIAGRHQVVELVEHLA